MLYGYSTGRYFRLRWFPPPSNGWFNAPPARLLPHAGDASWDVVSRRTAAPRSMGDGQVIGSVGQVRNRHINSAMSNCPSAEHVICWVLDRRGMRPPTNVLRDAR